MLWLFREHPIFKEKHLSGILALLIILYTPMILVTKLTYHLNQKLGSSQKELVTAVIKNMKLDLLPQNAFLYVDFDNDKTQLQVSREQWKTLEVGDTVTFMVEEGFFFGEIISEIRKAGGALITKKKLHSDPLIFPDTIYTQELIYYGMMCECPQWVTREGYELYETEIPSIPMDSLFVTIVEADGYQQNPFELEDWKTSECQSNNFVFEGRMSKNKLTWKGQDGREWSNRVFEYTDCKFKEGK